eukprot:5610527-Prymnesium_polylepis.1
MCCPSSSRLPKTASASSSRSNSATAPPCSSRPIMTIRPPQSGSSSCSTCAIDASSGTPVSAARYCMFLKHTHLWVLPSSLPAGREGNLLEYHYHGRRVTRHPVYNRFTPV